MSNKQTAMQELLDTLENDWLSPQPYIDLVKSKIEMEKQQIIDACKRGYKRNSFTPNFREQQELFEQYYNETFKSK
jgi:hypothetical protein